MGLTIHYQGQLKPDDACESFMQAVQRFAAEHNWLACPIPECHRQLTRMIQPEDPDSAEVEEMYEGLTHGLYLLPHPECEPLAFEFDTDRFMQDWCKTQFAGAGVHQTIIQLFRATEDLFEMLDVQDEAGFWEVADTAESRALLEDTFQRTRAEIESAASESPGCAVAVVTPSGRILDILAE